MQPTDRVFFDGHFSRNVLFKGKWPTEAWMLVDGQRQCVWRKGEPQGTGYRTLHITEFNGETYVYFMQWSLEQTGEQISSNRNAYHLHEVIKIAKINTACSIEIVNDNAYEFDFVENPYCYFYTAESEMTAADVIEKLTPIAFSGKLPRDDSYQYMIFCCLLTKKPSDGLSHTYSIISGYFPDYSFVFRINESEFEELGNLKYTIYANNTSQTRYEIIGYNGAFVRSNINSGTNINRLSILFDNCVYARNSDKFVGYCQAYTNTSSDGPKISFDERVPYGATGLRNFAGIFILDLESLELAYYVKNYDQYNYSEGKHPPVLSEDGDIQTILSSHWLPYAQVDSKYYGKIHTWTFDESNNLYKRGTEYDERLRYRISSSSFSVTGYLDKVDYDDDRIYLLNTHGTSTSDYEVKAFWLNADLEYVSDTRYTNSVGIIEKLDNENVDDKLRYFVYENSKNGALNLRFYKHPLSYSQYQTFNVNESMPYRFRNQYTRRHATYDYFIFDNRYIFYYVNSSDKKDSVIYCYDTVAQHGIWT